MSNALSRFQIVEGNPPHLPHKCSTCGSINGTFIDFGLDLEFYGTVYLCVEQCITQLANELGFRNPAQHKISLDAIAGLRAENNRLLDRNEALDNALGALRHLDATSPLSDDDVVSEPERQQDYPEELVRAEPKPTKQTAKSRRTDVQSDDGLDSFFPDFDAI